MRFQATKEPEYVAEQITIAHALLNGVFYRAVDFGKTAGGIKLAVDIRLNPFALEPVLNKQRPANVPPRTAPQIAETIDIALHILRAHWNLQEAWPEDSPEYVLWEFTSRLRKDFRVRTFPQFIREIKKLSSPTDRVPLDHFLEGEKLLV